MGIIVKNAPIEAHHSIGMVEWYHGHLWQVYFIITTEIPSMEPGMVLQMSLKVINNLVDPNRLVPTLLVFAAYLKMTKQDAPSPSIIQHALAKQKVTDEV